MIRRIKNSWSNLLFHINHKKRSRAIFGSRYAVDLKPVSTAVVNPPAVVGIYPDVEGSQLLWISVDEQLDCMEKYYNENNRLLSFFKTIGNVVPVFYTESYHNAVELLFRLKTEQLIDCFIVSSDLEILKICYQEYAEVGRVWCVPSGMELSEIMKTAHSCCINTVCTNGDYTKEQVFYLKQRLITVWQRDYGNSAVSLYKLMLSGCRAIVTEQPKILNALLQTFSQTPVIIQEPIIIGHRGISSNKKYMENTLTTAIEAIKLGANVIDVDTRLTKDGKLIAFHGWVIDRLLEGSGEVRSYTLEELQNMKYRYGMNPDEKVLQVNELVQTLIETFPEKDLMFTFEIGGDIVGSVEKLLELLTAYPLLQDKVMVKCKNGHYGYAELKKQLPYLPVRNYVNEITTPVFYKNYILLHFLAEQRKQTIQWCGKYRFFHKKLLKQIQLRSNLVIKLMQNTVKKVKNDLFSGIELLITDINLAKDFAYALECDKEICLSVGENFTPTVTLHGCAVAEETTADEVVILDGESFVSIAGGNITALKKGVCHIYLKKKTAYHDVEYFVLSDAVKLIVE